MTQTDVVTTEITMFNLVFLCFAGVYMVKFR